MSEIIFNQTSVLVEALENANDKTRDDGNRTELNSGLDFQLLVNEVMM